MLVKALKSFVGKISMTIGETREIFDEKLANDLLRAGHVAEVEGKAKKAEAPKKAETVKKK